LLPAPLVRCCLLIRRARDDDDSNRIDRWHWRLCLVYLLVISAVLSDHLRSWCDRSLTDQTSLSSKGRVGAKFINRYKVLGLFVSDRWRSGFCLSSSSPPAAFIFACDSKGNFIAVVFYVFINLRRLERSRLYLNRVALTSDMYGAGIIPGHQAVITGIYLLLTAFYPGLRVSAMKPSRKTVAG